MLHGLVFFECEAIGFIEDRWRDHHLADIVHQPGNAGFTHQRFIQFHLPGKRYHQRADRDRVHVRVFV